MRVSRRLILGLVLGLWGWQGAVCAPAWSPAEEWDWITPAMPIVYRMRVLASAEGRRLHLPLALFDSRRARLAVLDLGPGLAADWRERARAAGLIAAVNGGFFHPDGRPLGLVIAEGQAINRLETGKPLSGVLYGDGQGIHLMRLQAFVLHPGIDALIQAGPYLVEAGRAVRIRSRGASERRTFVATDWRGHWLLGATQEGLTLPELAELLAQPGLIAPWPVDRALNLDGGSSTGFYVERGEGQTPVWVRSQRPVRNLVGVRRR